jgi:peptide/nickel transport system permease protein
MKHLRRRFIHGVLLVIGVSFLSFLLADLAPGSFFDEMKLNPQISQATLAGLKNQYGFNQPLPVRYLRWVHSVLKGDWGYSFAYNSPVRGLLIVRAKNTLLLTVAAASIAWLIAVPLGVCAANRPGKGIDRLCMGGTSLLLSVPEVVVVLGLLYFVVRSHALPVGGMVSLDFDQLGLWSKMRDLVVHMIVPVTVLVLASLPVLVRHVRTSMMEVLRAPFIQAARGHGIGPVSLLLRYALPAASNSLISLFGFSVGGLLSTSLLVEVVTAWPGLGPLLLEATMSRDLYIAIGVVMASTCFMVGGNLLADVLLVMVDPRVRTE